MRKSRANRGSGPKTEDRTAVHRTKVLVVEDEPVARMMCAKVVSDHGYEVVEAESCAEAERQCHATRPHAAILDYQLGDGDALALMDQLRKIDAALPIVILTAHGSIELAVEAMLQGADHFLTKPVKKADALTMVLDRCLAEGQNRRRRRAYDFKRERHRPNPFEGRSAAIRRLEKAARRFCDVEEPVLLLGETGSGKGVLARWLHENGPRADEPFIDLNCAGLKPEFLESELFGHKKGAFTGATESKPGLFELADRGTLFLDEIGDMDPGIQAKLLKVVEDQTFHRLGGVNDRRVDVRLVAATHRDLAAMVDAEEFRADLFFRISTLRLDIPPLRHRREDIPFLACELLTSLGRAYGRGETEITPQAVEALTRYSWPGNFRELRHVLKRALILNDGDALDVEDLGLQDVLADEPIGERTPAPPQPPAAPRTPRASRTGASAEKAWTDLRSELRRQIESTLAAGGKRLNGSAPPLGRWLAEDLLLAASAAAEGVLRQGAELLGVSKSTFARRLHKLEDQENERPSAWQSVSPLLDELLRVDHPPGTDLLAAARQAMLEEIEAQLPGDATAGAALMGVAPRTFRDWCRALH